MNNKQKRGCRDALARGAPRKRKMWLKRKKKRRNEHVEESDEDMSYELQEGLELLMLVGEFEKRYRECPERTRFSGMRKVRRWRRELDIFREGYKVGTEWSQKTIMTSGWLKEDIQEALEREEKEKKEEK